MSAHAIAAPNVAGCMGPDVTKEAPHVLTFLASSAFGNTSTEPPVGKALAREVVKIILS